MRVNTLRLRLTGALAVAVACGALVPVAITRWPLPQLLVWLYGSAAAVTAAGPAADAWRIVAIVNGATLLLALVFWLSAVLVAPLRRLVRALEGAVLSYRDGDFNVSVATGRDDELADLTRAHHALGDAFREQRQHLAQRELMLDTVVQNTPVALVLVDAKGRIAYANIAARHLLGQGRSLDGADFVALLRAAPAGLLRAVETGEDSLLSIAMDDGEETFHLSQRAFRLQGRPHRLYSFRRMTRELSRQEVATGKRVIRVISHELNNSLAPISSLAHSGAELLRRNDLERLPGVLATIAERARHLHGFLEGYARFAKMPTPTPTQVAWQPFLDALSQHAPFRRAGDVPATSGWFDPVQIEQALINLLKNAHEAGGPAGEITLSLASTPLEMRIDVADRGHGMSSPVLEQALLPFYSTKRHGTGLGLALAREIAEAHGGRIALANREGGGLRVTIALPHSRNAATQAAGASFSASVE